MIAIASACQTKDSALVTSPAPSALAIADATAPPIAPPERVCVSISSGNDNAIAAREMEPSRPMNQTSARLTMPWTKKARVLGVAMRTNSGRGGCAVSMCLVRGSMAKFL